MKPRDEEDQSAPVWGHSNGFVDVTLRDLTPTEVRVWLILFRDTKPDGTARTGQTDIAERAGLGWIW